jgi:hypothetical protein
MFMAIVNKTSEMEKQKRELLLESDGLGTVEEENKPLVVDNCMLR